MDMSVTRLQESGWFSDVLTIMCSNASSEETIKKAYEAGADFYLVKPNIIDGMERMLTLLWSRNWEY